MAQPEFIFKISWAHPPLAQGDTLPIIYARKQQSKGRKTIGGISFNEIENVGIDKSQIQWTPPKMSAVTKTAATAEGVKSVCRRLRQQEAAELDAIDAEIADLHEKLKDAKARRMAAMRKAFNNGNVVRLAEAVARCEERLPK
jgi:hypothetical protein